MARRTLKDFIRNLRRGVKTTFAKKQMILFGELAISLIVQRTRQGYGVRRTGEKQRKLKPLSASYIKHRTRNAGSLDATTAPRRSNLTYTGQLLRSMRVKEASNSRVIWGPNKKNRRGGLTNEKLGEIVAKQGRPFNFLSKRDINKMIRLVDKSLQKQMRRV